MRTRKYRTFVGDFETTVFDGQEHTEVWASASVELNTEDVKIFHSIEDQFEYFKALKTNLIIYYHNLKFDGSFWLSYFLDKLGFTPSFEIADEENNDYKWSKEQDMENNTYKCSISEMNQWYSITVKVNGKIIEFRDSYKLLPYSVERIGQSFNTKHKKLDIEYEGFRYAGCPITEEEKAYIANDVLVVKEALEIMFNDGHNKLTIGSCCLSEFKTGYKNAEWDSLFPDLSELDLNSELFKYPTIDAYIRRSYKGGWCYLVPEKANRVYGDGCTFDVNSLYPSVMHSSSGNRYPVGLPTFWKGNFIPDQAFMDNHYYFIRIRTRFYLKDNKLPFIQIKGDPLYRGNEQLTTSDVRNPDTGTYHTHILNDITNELQDTRVTMTLTMTDYLLFLDHYNVVEFEILDGCYFETKIGLFDDYLDKYAKIKATSKGAVRETAKLFLNNLYGKLASNTNSSFKIPYLDEDKVLRFVTIPDFHKKPGYIPVGSAITSYARNFTIRHAQLNYHGPDAPGFIYADTDSIHCNLPASEIKGLAIHSSKFSHWSLDAVWDKGYFSRQKTYIEHVLASDSLPSIQQEALSLGYTNDSTFYDVKCAGMPKNAQAIFRRSLMNEPLTANEIEDHKYTAETVDFINKGSKLEDFKTGLTIPSGNLKSMRVRGGTILKDKEYVMRDFY